MNSHQHIENLNYYRDSRVTATLRHPDHPITVTVHYIDDDTCDYSEEVEFPSRREICDLCSGKGTVVNPSIDCGGISAHDFEEDPDFAEDYFNGVYDIVCPQCAGHRVIAVIDEAKADPVMLERYHENERINREIEAEMRAELRMGA